MDDIKRPANRNTIFELLAFLLLLMTGCSLFSKEDAPSYTIEVEPNEFCSVTPLKITNPVGTNASFAVIPNSGYEVKSATLVSKDGDSLAISINNGIILLTGMTEGNYSLVVSCEKIPYYTITVKNETGNDSLGTVTPLGVTTVKEGDSLRVSAITEGLCSSIEKFIVDGLPLSENSYKFNDTHGNHEVIIKFKKNIDAWNLVHAVWEIRYVDIDGYGAIPPYSEIFIFYKNGTYIRYYNSKYDDKSYWKISSGINFNWGGWDCDIEYIDETTMISRYTNSYNQVVRKYYKKIDKLPS